MIDTHADSRHPAAGGALGRRVFLGRAAGLGAGRCSESSSACAFGSTAACEAAGADGALGAAPATLGEEPDDGLPAAPGTGLRRRPAGAG